MTAILEATLSWLFHNARGRDSKSFCTRPAFSGFPEPTIPVTSPDCGPSGTTFSDEYTADGAGRFPTLEWSLPSDWAAPVEEWLLVAEDPDAPLPTPIVHGIYGGIHPSKTRVGPADFGIEDGGESLLKGGFYYGANRRSKVYIPPRPLLNHGVHRYFFQVIALGAPLETDLLRARASREQIADAIDGKVLGWGVWVGNAERRW